MSVVKLTKDNFADEAIKSDKPVLIDFFSDWCVPCKMLSPIIEEVAQTNSEFKVCKVNVDDEAEISQAFRISSIPTIAVMKNGKVTEISVGLKSKSEILEMLK